MENFSNMSNLERMQSLGRLYRLNQNSVDIDDVLEDLRKQWLRIERQIKLKLIFGEDLKL